MARDVLQTKLQRDKDLRVLATIFLEESAKASIEDENDLKEAFTAFSFRIVDGYCFRTSKSVEDAERGLLRRAMDLLGGKHGNEKDASTAAWEAAAKHIQSGAKATDGDVNSLIANLTAHVDINVECILPNRLVVLEPSISSVVIGPVKIERASSVLTRLHGNAPQKTVFEVGGCPGDVQVVDGQLKVQVHPLCWSVDLSAAPGNREEEAVWSIEVAVSLLRLSHQKATEFIPRIGDVEPHPVELMRSHNELIVSKANGLTFGGRWVPARYLINSDVVSWLAADQIQKWTAAVFAPKKGSIAERVSVGLGWLSRARQALARSERLLFGFTAIEALLASDDKSAPVVQAVSRHLAAILTDDNSKRIVHARDIRRWYDRRSALVHLGRRDITRGVANAVQQVAEIAYHRVLTELHPDLPTSDFHQTLSDASYGLAWPS